MHAATTILGSNNVCIGFDSMTQEGVLVNSVRFTTQHECYLAAVDQLPGGMVADYAEYMMDTVDSLSGSYPYFMDKDLLQTKNEIIDQIKNSMIDHCAANHAALHIICSNWKKTLNELNCHLQVVPPFTNWTSVRGSCLATTALLQILFFKKISSGIRTVRGTLIALFCFWTKTVSHAVFHQDTEETIFTFCTQ